MPEVAGTDLEAERWARRSFGGADSLRKAVEEQTAEESQNLHRGRASNRLVGGSMWRGQTGIGLSYMLRKKPMLTRL